MKRMSFGSGAGWRGKVICASFLQLGVSQMSDGMRTNRSLLDITRTPTSCFSLRLMSKAAVTPAKFPPSTATVCIALLPVVGPPATQQRLRPAGSLPPASPAKPIETAIPDTVTCITHVHKPRHQWFRPSRSALHRDKVHFLGTGNRELSVAASLQELCRKS